MIQNKVQEIFHKNKSEFHSRKNGRETPYGFEDFVYSDLCY